MSEDARLYDVARQVCHEHGLPWTDPRTGVTYPPPALPPPADAVREDVDPPVVTTRDKESS